MPKGRFKWSVYQKYVKPLPMPSRKEQIKIKHSLGLDADHPFPRCPGKGKRSVRDPFIRKLEKAGDFSHSGNRREHICDFCQCKHVAGWGTKHYGVGYCYFHDVDSGRQVSKSMTIAIQQGYPLNPIKYRSDRDYIEEVRKQAEAAHGRLDLGEELNVLRAHMQEVEEMYSKTGAESLTMKGKDGEAVLMTDDVKIDRVVKLVKAISDLSRNAYIIEESDYVHIDEVKQWLYGIYRMLDNVCKKHIVGEIDSNDLSKAFQTGLKNIAMPATGRRKK